MMHICVVLCSFLPSPWAMLNPAEKAACLKLLTFTKTYKAGNRKGIRFAKLPQRSSAVCPRSDSKTGTILGREPRKAGDLVPVAPVLSQGAGLGAERHCGVRMAAHADVGSETVGTLTPAFSSQSEYLRSFLGVKHHP